MALGLGSGREKDEEGDHFQPHFSSTSPRAPPDLLPPLKLSTRSGLLGLLGRVWGTRPSCLPAPSCSHVSHAFILFRVQVGAGLQTSYPDLFAWYKHLEEFQKDYVLASGEETSGMVFESFCIGYQDLGSSRSYTIYRSGDCEWQQCKSNR